MSATIDGLPLSLTQQYFHDIILAEGFDPTWQHVSMTLQTGRRLEPGRVEEVVGRLAARHPLLATRLDYRHGEPVLRQAAGDRSVTVTLDLREASAEEFELRLTRAAEEPFDLLAGPLWRVVAAQGPDGSGALSFVGHHLVADAISTWIMFKDFGRLYFGEELDPPTEPYATFAADQHAMRDEPPQARLAYWEEQLDAAEPLLVATSRPSSSELAASAAMPLNPGPIDSRIVLARARATRVTPLALLTAITISGVREATGQRDLTCAVVTDVRGARFQSTVGTFSELMFIRERSGEAGEAARVTALRDAFFAGWRNHLPVALLRERLACFRDRARTAPNPSDIFLNFIPIGTSSDRLNLNPQLADPTRDFRTLDHRSRAPTRRMLGPLFFFMYVLERQLHGSVVVRRGDTLAPLNRSVAGAVARELGELASTR